MASGNESQGTAQGSVDGKLLSGSRGKGGSNLADPRGFLLNSGLGGQTSPLGWG